MNLFLFTLIAVALFWVALVPVIYLLRHMLISDTPLSMGGKSATRHDRKQAHELVFQRLPAAISELASLCQVKDDASFELVSPYVMRIIEKKAYADTFTHIEQAIVRLTLPEAKIASPALDKFVGDYKVARSAQSPAELDWQTLLQVRGEMLPAIVSIAYASDKRNIQ